MGCNSMIAVGAGAAIGAWIRWWLGIMLNNTLPTLPLGTLAANLIGGYVMGLCMGLFALSNTLPPEFRLFLITGMLGGLTTFSTFSGEAVTLLARGEFGWAAAHILLHVVGSLTMTSLGVFSIHLFRD